MSTTARYLFSLAALVAGLASTRPAAACSCMEQGFDAARAGAVAIFEARVASIEVVDGTRHVHVDVVQTWLAAEHEHVEIVTADNEAACGYSFEVGRSYLVYASSVEGEAYRVSLCSRTRRMEDADDDRALLGSGVVPVDIVDAPEEEATTRPPPTRAGCASCGVTRAGGAEAALTMLVGIALVALRRRDRS
jgi:hypothetical protein